MRGDFRAKAKQRVLSAAGVKPTEKAASGLPPPNGIVKTAFRGREFACVNDSQQGVEGTGDTLGQNSDSH